MPTIELKITANTKDATASVSRLAKEIARLQGGQRNGSSMPQLGGINIDQIRKQAEEIKKLSKDERRLAMIAHRQQVAEATEAARRQTALKKGEIQHFIQQEKAKQRQSEISAKAQISAASNAARAIENSKRREYQEFVRLEREKTRIANAETKKRSSGPNLGRAGEAGQQLGGGMQGLGGVMTGAVTLPLTALATLGTKSVLEIDAVRTKITALVGDSEKANQKIIELRNLANQSVGLTQTAALEGYAQLKGIGGIADETINKLLASMGKLNAAFKIEDQAGFVQNLNQIFTQGFERSDIKEAIGRVPFFEQLLEQAFGTKDGEKLRALKESGKMTLDTFLSGMSEAVNGDARISNIQENLTVKMAKGFERLNVALAPIGEIILQTVVPVLEIISPYIESLSNRFAALSPAMKAVAVGFGAIVAALGPALIAIGAVITFIGSLVSSVALLGGFVAVMKIAGIVVLALVGALIQLAPPLVAAVAAAVALYNAWQTNFGGIRDLTIQVWSVVKDTTSSAMTAVYGFVQKIGGQVIKWWNDNYPLIQRTVQTVSDAIKNIVQGFLSAIQGFWQDYGGYIQSVVSTSWDYIKNYISIAIDQIGNFIKLGMQIINGDWSGAWQTILDIIKNGTAALTLTLSTWVSNAGNIFLMLVEMAVKYGIMFQLKLVEYMGKAVAAALYVLATLPQRMVSIVPQLVSAGVAIVGAIWEGIKKGFSDGASASASMFGLGAAMEWNSTAATGLTGNVNNLNKSLGNLGKTGSGAGKKLKEVLTPLQELNKSIADAKQNLEFSSSGGVPGLKAELGELNELQSALDELINLRKKYNISLNDTSLLSAGASVRENIATIRAEIKLIQETGDAIEKAWEMNDSFKKIAEGAKEPVSNLEKLNALLTTNKNISASIGDVSVGEMRSNAKLADAQVRTDNLKKAKEELIQTGVAEISQLSEQLRLFGVVDEVEQQRIKNQYEMASARSEWIKQGWNEKEIEVLAKVLELDQERVVELTKQLQVKKQLADADALYKSVTEDLSEEIRELNIDLGLSAELSKADAVAKLLQTEAYQKLTPEMRAAILAKAQEIDQLKSSVDAQKKYREAFEETASIFEDALTNIVEGNWKGLFDSILDEMKRFLIRAAAEWLTSKFFKLISGQSTGGSSGSAGGFNIGNIFKQIFGGGGGSGGGIGGTPNFNPSATGGFNFLGGGSGSLPSFNFGGSSVAGQPRGVMGDIKGQFGIGGTGSRGGIGLSGGVAVAGMAANAIGGMIGGRAGNVLSMAGTGMSIGMMFGGPWGAAIGAGIGAIAGLFGGDPKRKADKKENLPALQKVFADALKQLRELAADRNALFSDPAGTLAKALELRAQIESGGGIQFQSKKYRGVAKTQIAQKLAEADAIIKNIREMSDSALASIGIDARLETSFASGVYMDKAFMKQFGNFKRRNGMLPGMFTGRDTLPSMLAPGELVLNPIQQARAIAAAGFDIFQHAQIPNYASGTFVTPAPGIPNPSTAAQGAFTQSSNDTKRPIIVQINLANSGLVESDVKDIVVDSLDDMDVQVKVVETYDKGKSRQRGGSR